MKRGILITVILIIIILQFIPVNRSNPPVSQEIDASASVIDVLQESCYDCHSNQTTWPWYSYVAPVSWLVARDVHEARDDMNFSTWDQYSDEEKSEFREEIWEEVEEGEMPLAIYTMMHASASVTDQDKSILQEWSLQSEEDRQEAEEEDIAE